MKRLISVFLALASVICIAFVFGGCSDEELEEGKFYTVTEAYENGYITRNDVLSIAYYQNGGRNGNENVMSEDYAPLPKTPEQLSVKTEKAIKQTYFNDYLNQVNDATLSDIYIDKYYGTYGGCVAVMVECNYIGYPQALRTETVDGIKIFYKDGNGIEIWRNTEI